MTGDDPGAKVALRVSWLACVGQAAAVVSAGAKLILGGADPYLGIWPWFFLAALVGISVLSLVEVVQRSSTQRSTTAYVVCSQLVLVAHLWVWDAGHARAMPAFDNTAALGVGLAFLVFPRLVASVYVAITQAVYVLLLPRALGWAWTSWIVLSTVTAALVCLVARNLIDESVAQMRRTLELSEEVEGLEEQMRARTHALNNWLDIVHREIIGTLLPASREPSTHTDLVRSRAVTALETLSAFRLPESEEGFARFVQKTATALDLHVSVEQQGEWSVEGPQLSLRSSISEALRNVQRHSGTDTATITARFQPSRWRVTVIDAGKGFDVDAVAFARSHGLDVSLRSPWHAAGGTATVTSAPGAGTSISLAWNAATPTDLSWSPTNVRWLSALVVLSLLQHMAIGWGAGGYHSTALLVLGQLTIVVATLLAFFRPRWDYVGLGLLFVSQLVLAANIAPAVDSDLRTWFAGAIAGPIGVMAFRGRWRWSAFVVLSSWFAAAWLMGGSSLQVLVLGRLLGSYVGPLLALVFAYVGELLRRLDEDLRVQSARRAATQLRAAEVRAGLERWDSENSPLIDFVTPTLVSLASGGPITVEVADTCRAVEACCRDYLRSPGFVDRNLLATAFEARRRGCEIVLDVATPPSEPLLGALRRAVADAVVCGCTTLVLTRIAGGPTTLVVKGEDTCLRQVSDAVPLRLRSEASLDLVPTYLGTALLLELTADSA